MQFSSSAKIISQSPSSNLSDQSSASTSIIHFHPADALKSIMTSPARFYLRRRSGASCEPSLRCDAIIAVSLRENICAKLMKSVDNWGCSKKRRIFQIFFAVLKTKLNSSRFIFSYATAILLKNKKKYAQLKLLLWFCVKKSFFGRLKN